MKPRIQLALEITVACLLALVVALVISLREGWKNERFLDATVNHYTTTK